MLVKVAQDMPFETRREWKVAQVWYSGEKNQDGLVTCDDDPVVISYGANERKPYSAAEQFAKNYLNIESDDEHRFVGVFISDDTIALYRVKIETTIEYIAEFA